MHTAWGDPPKSAHVFLEDWSLLLTYSFSLPLAIVKGKKKKQKWKLSGVRLVAPCNAWAEASTILWKNKLSSIKPDPPGKNYQIQKEINQHGWESAVTTHKRFVSRRTSDIRATGNKIMIHEMFKGKDGIRKGSRNRKPGRSENDS